MPGRALRLVPGVIPVPTGLAVESPQCPEGHYDAIGDDDLIPAPRGLNPLNARKGITTPYFLRPEPPGRIARLNPLNARKGITTSLEERHKRCQRIRVESPQCPEGHYDENKREDEVMLLVGGLNPLNARKGITTRIQRRVTSRQ